MQSREGKLTYLAMQEEAIITSALCRMNNEYLRHHQLLIISACSFSLLPSILEFFSCAAL